MCADGHIVYTLKMAGCFFFSLSPMWLLFAAETHPFQQRWQSRFWNLLFYFMGYVIEHIHFFFFFALPFWFVLCLCFVFPAVTWGFSFLFSWSSAFSLCYIPPLTFSLRLPLFFPLLLFCLFAGVCCCFCFFFFFLRTPAAVFDCWLLVFFFFFFSFSNSLLRTRK